MSREFIGAMALDMRAYTACLQIFITLCLMS